MSNVHNSKISLSGGNWPLIYPKMLKWKFSLRFILAGALYQEEVTSLKGVGETTFEVLEGIYYYTPAQKLTCHAEGIITRPEVYSSATLNLE